VSVVFAQRKERVGLEHHAQVREKTIFQEDARGGGGKDWEGKCVSGVAHRDLSKKNNESKREIDEKKTKNHGLNEVTRGDLRRALQLEKKEPGLRDT